MSKAATFVLMIFVFLVNSVSSQAQGVCATPSSKLICVLPQLFNQGGGVNLPNAAHRAHFDNDFESNASALTASVGSQLTSLRLASPASGVIFTFDKTLGVMKRSTESYGPILGERAETLGIHRMFFAATYQFFPFSTLDGIDLKHLPAVYRHGDTVNPDGTARNSAVDPPSPGIPGVELEYINTTNRIDLKVHQITFFANYGLTSRVDLSVAVPVLNVRMGVTSNATIVRTATISQPISSQFYQQDPNSLVGRLYAGTGPAKNCAATLSCSGYFHYFDPSNPATSLNATLSSFRTATGLGDVILRVKDTLLKGERAAVALGVDVRVPSGDEKNFLGAGAAGIKNFIAASYRARVSPHVNVGYEFNGSSILAGNSITGQKARLPDQFFYSGGVDAGVTKRLTCALDLLGERLYGAPHVVKGPFVDVLGVSHPDIPQTTLTHRSFSMNDLAVGAKVHPGGNFLLTGNVQFKLDNGGLRAKIVPLGGISYTF
ncbi:MAG: hypothetical protein DMG70_05070 [Acidobacteria bacterium]|nr:MAG: hypothetical protein DMG70_05070 [Acidobacteriota bacterium]